VATVVADDGLCGIVNAEALCLVEELLEDTVEFFRVPNLVTENMRQLVDGHVQEHVFVVVVILFVPQTQVYFLLVDGVALVALEKLQVLDPGLQRFELVLDVFQHRVQLIVILHDPIKNNVRD